MKQIIFFEKLLRIMLEENKQYQEASVSKIARRKKDPFRVLVSCLISLRTKDAVTSAASAKLFALADTPETMKRLDVRSIEKAIYPAGFYKTKARRIKAISGVLLEKYNGKVPDTIDELLTLKGVGRKTANIVVTVGFGKHGVAVDTHVHRLSNRIGVVTTKTPDKTEMVLREILPKKYWITYNDLLVVYGQNVCTPVSPHCSTCRVASLCKRVGVSKHR